jgi:Zn ribbon nucleic-acid-binding protein
LRPTVSVNKQADKKATDQIKSVKCEKCGHDAKEDNRLVKLGLIPEALKLF